MKNVTSITAVEETDIFDTGCKPMRVFCDDLKHYVCKHSEGRKPAWRLIRECLAASFLKAWNLCVPDFALVKGKREHLPDSLSRKASIANQHLFGSFFDRELKEVDSFLSGMSSYQKGKFPQATDLLKIAFFDIWVGNDDRHPGNYNLMIASIDSEYQFVPIDHEQCFHSGDFTHANYTLSYDESLICSPLIFKFFRAQDLSNQTFLEELRKDWYLCHTRCQQELRNIIDSLPVDWGIESDFLTEALNTYLFTDEWFEECWLAFLNHVQTAITRNTNGNAI